MPEILRLLFQFHSEYSGDPRYISGNAFRHALSLQVNTSVGIFTKVSKLNPPRLYYEFFLIRTKKCFMFPHFEKFFNWNTHSEEHRFFFLPQFVTFDVMDPPEDLIDTIHTLEPIQLGGQRHCGFGAVTLSDSLLIDLEEIPMPYKASHLVLIAPTVYPPPYVVPFAFRREYINLWNHGKKNSIEVVAPGQFFRLKPGKDIQKLAMRGIARKVKANHALFSQFGFGEFILYNWKEGHA